MTALPFDRLDDPVWKARHELKLREARAQSFEVVLLGDSITEGLERTGPDALHDFRAVWQRYYAGRRVLNLGFDGDGTQHLLWRIMHGEIDDLAPKVAIVLIGTNDIGWLGRSAAETVDGINTVVDELRRRLPATSILLVGILPSDRSADVLEAADGINAALAARYGTGAVPGVVYQDVSSAFFVNGVLDVSLFSDPHDDPPAPALHPTPEGYAGVAAALEPTLRRLLGES